MEIQTRRATSPTIGKRVEHRPLPHAGFPGRASESGIPEFPAESACEVEVRWYVCHTRPRCEKRFVDVMQRHNFEHYLPLVNSVRRYRSGVKHFRKPLFPGYVFARLPLEQKALIYQENYLLRTLTIESEARFLDQIEQIRRLIASGFEIAACPPLQKGTRVKVVSGVLAGVDALVEDPREPERILISFDILQQAIRVHIPREYLRIEE